MAVIIPDEFTLKGPQPFDPPFTFSAQEAITTGALVSLGTLERSVKLCDVGETPVGWAQAGADINAQIDISLFGPVWKVDIDAGSAAIGYGDIVEVANDGKVKKGAGVGAGVIVGLAIRGGAASGQALIIPVVSTPDPTT